VPDELLDIKALHRMTKLPLSWLYVKASQGELPSYKCGKYRRFSLREVEAWLSQHRWGGNAPSANRRETAEE
jgi:excisionase family DNA binding protein